MEINSLIILGSLFIVLLIAVGMFIIVLAHKNKTKAELKLQVVEALKQKEIAENTLITQEQERQQLGLELHDDLGPSFTAVKLTLSLIEQQLRVGKPEKALEHVSMVKDSLQESIQKFSDISRILYPAALHRNGLKKAVEDVVVQCNNAIGEKRIYLNYSLEKIPSQLKEVTIFRICQELLNNAVKHSRATEIKLDLSNHKQMIHIDYLDNGKGFDVELQAKGLGLGSLKGRCEALGGAINFTSKIGEGTGVTILIPHII